MAVQQPRGFHPWHDIPTGRRPPHELTAVIEIPTNERNKRGPLKYAADVPRAGKGVWVAGADARRIL
jgi:hypothetical protein